MPSPFWLMLIAGVSLLAVELIVFQFATFWLFFLGLGALVAAGYAWLVGDASYTATIGVFLAASIAFTAILYVPIKRWLKKPAGMSGNDAIGQTVTVEQAFDANGKGLVNWSGSDWQAELASGVSAELAVGDQASVVEVKGIRLFVKPLNG